LPGVVDVDQMRADLLTARKARDKVTEVALKRALARFENAEAPASDQKVNLVGNTGPTEVERLALTDYDRAALLRDEIAEADAAAQQYADGGRGDAAEQLRAETNVLRHYLGDDASAPPE
jgi:uncharacterized protein YqeY